MRKIIIQMHLKRIALALIACVFLLVKADPIQAQTAAISTFASSPTERAANYEIHIARRKAAGLDSYYRQVLAETNPWGEIGRRFVYLQMDERDLVDVVAYFWIHTHGLSMNLMPSGISQRNYEQVASHGTWRAVRGQVQTMFDNEKAMEGLSNSVRQRYADSVMFEIVFQQQALIKAMDKGDEDSGTRAAFIALNRSMIGFDITKAALGPGGFYSDAFVIKNCGYFGVNHFRANDCAAQEHAPYHWRVLSQRSAHAHRWVA
jgi:Fe-S cluster biosynthesis and repair protein YggX